MRHNHIGMRMNTIGLYVVLLVITAFSCEDNLQEPVQVEFEFRLLNEQGQPSTTFKEGENFVFSFLITNSLKEDIAWYSSCKLFSIKSLYSVYKLVMDDSGNQSYEFVGQPFVAPVICQDVPILVAPGEEYYLKMPWLFNPNNANLLQGEYKVDFELVDFEFKGNFNEQKITKSFYQNFEIEQ